MGSTHPPKQRRSQETLTRLLAATRTLLEEKPFDEISVNEIVERAGSSVGAFYARFTGKEALLDSLTEAFTGDAAVETRRVAGSKDWGSLPLEDVVAEYVRVLMRGYRRHRGALRALVGRSISSKRGAAAPHGPGFVSPLPLIELIRSRRSEIGHPNPDVAAHLGVEMVVSAVRERVLFPELSANFQPSSHVTDAIFAEELTRALLSFLGVNAPHRSG